MAILTRLHRRSDSHVRQRLVRRHCNTKRSSERPSFTTEPVKSREDDLSVSTCTTLSSLSETSVGKVCFAQHVQVYQADHVVKEPAAVWYSTHQVKAFLKQAKNAAKVMQQQNNTLQGAYQLYANGLVNYDSQKTTEAGGTSITMMIGLHGLAASSVFGKRKSAAHQRLARRLLQDLNDNNSNNSNNMAAAEQRTRLMAQASRCMSQSSCLAAAQLARWWASH